MKLHRFIGNFYLSKKEIEIINPEIIRQIKDVLRLEEGDVIITSNGQGKSAEVVLVSIAPDKIKCRVEGVETEEEKGVQVNLYLAILKKENFELATQKAVEAGVRSITPIITERTIKTGLNMARLEKIILEASEQSGRSFVPTLSPTLNFENALAFGIASNEKIIFHLGNNLTPSPSPYKGEGTKNIKSSSIFIGPEGGFTEKEVKMAKDSGYTVASLGPLTLRGETAAIIATYRAVYGV